MSIIDDFKKQSYEEGYADGKRDAVNDDPDVIRVVRCKDCPLSKTDPNDYEDVYWCDFTPGQAHHSMDYCSEGARQKQMR